MAELDYAIRTNFPQVYDTLKQTSYDSENRVYLCQSQLSVIDLDALTRELYPNTQPASFDALLIEEDTKKIFCIEFKNQTTSSISSQQIQKKAADSLATLSMFCSANNVNFSEYRIIACVVYKADNSSYTYRRFKENIVHFGLEAYQGGGFEKIITNGIDFFTREFQKKYVC